MRKYLAKMATPKDKLNAELYTVVLKGTEKDIRICLDKQTVLDKINGKFGPESGSILHIAINGTFSRGEKGTLKVLDLLIEKGRAKYDAKDMYGNNPFLHAAKLNHSHIMQYFFRKCNPRTANKYGLTVLHIAALRGNIHIMEKVKSMDSSVVEDLIDKSTGKFRRYINTLGANINIDGWTALHCAIIECHQKCVKFLVRHKISTEKRNKDGLKATELLESYTQTMNHFTQHKASQCIGVVVAERTVQRQGSNPAVGPLRPTEIKRKHAPLQSKVCNDLKPEESNRIIDNLGNHLTQYGLTIDELVERMLQNKNILLGINNSAPRSTNVKKRIPPKEDKIKEVKSTGARSANRTPPNEDEVKKGKAAGTNDQRFQVNINVYGNVQELVGNKGDVQALKGHGAEKQTESKSTEKHASKADKSTHKIVSDIIGMLSDYLSDNDINLSSFELVQLIQKYYRAKESDVSKESGKTGSDFDSYSSEDENDDRSQKEYGRTAYDSYSDSYDDSSSINYSSDSFFSESDNDEPREMSMNTGRKGAMNFANQKYPTDDILEDIADEIHTKDLLMFGKHLGVGQIRGGQTSNEKAFEMLKAWRDGKMKHQTKDFIKKSLSDIFDALKRSGLKKIL